MDDYHASVMIALLPTESDWCHISLPHLTLVSVGEIRDLQQTAHNELAKSALSLAMTCPVLTLEVIGPDTFGDEEKVSVLKLKPTPALVAMRQAVESWNASEHPFNPHVTIGPEGSIGDTMPTRITFDRIMVAWGYDSLTYRLQEDGRI